MIDNYDLQLIENIINHYERKSIAYHIMNDIQEQVGLQKSYHEQFLELYNDLITLHHPGTESYEALKKLGELHCKAMEEKEC